MIDILGLIGIALVILIPLIGFVYDRRKKIKSIYYVVWEGSSSLKPKDVLGERPFDKYYYRRPEDDLISKILVNRKNVLIKGPPLIGKSRAVYQALINLSRTNDVIIPRCIDITLESFLFPYHINFWRPKIIFIDDLHIFVEKQNFEHLFRTALEAHIAIIATCRSGIEYKKVESRMLEKNIDLKTIFGENVVELHKISDLEGKKIADKIGKPWNKIKFDGTVGSIFMRLGEMEKRFNECNDIEKTIMRDIKKLYIAGISKEKQIFPLGWIKTIAKKEGLEGRDFEWTGWLESLRDKEFIKLERDALWAEEAYLDDIVKPTAEISDLNILRDMIPTFSAVPDALFRVGIRAYEGGIIRIEKVEYTKTAIAAYEEVLKVYTLEKFPIQYAAAQNNLGNTYQTLAEVEDKTANCKRAIRAFEEALKVYTLERFPMQRAMTQNNLGNAYKTLAEVEDKAENCKRAIKAYEEAFKVRTFAQFPMDYAMTQNNLGATYKTLAEVEDKAENCKRAIKAYEEALKVRTFAQFPMNYAMIHNNLGAIYIALAEIEDKTENCKRATVACKEALKVYTFEQLPIPYAMTQNIVGVAYSKLAEVEDRVANSKKAIKAFEEALKVCTLERFPVNYAMIQNNLGSAYGRLAEVEDKAKNCKKAIRACDEALKVYNFAQFPMDYAMTQNNLGASYTTLADVEDKAENCKRAISVCEEALRVYTLERSPLRYAMTKHLIGITYGKLADVENKTENCKRAIKACEEALKVLTREEFPEIYLLVENNRRRLLDSCGSIYW